MSDKIAIKNYISIGRESVKQLRNAGDMEGAYVYEKLVDAAAVELAALTARVAELEANVKQLQGFADAMFDLADWPEGGDIDGFDFQDTAVKHGLLKPEQKMPPCCDDCKCAEFYGDNEEVTCYVRTSAALQVQP